MTRILAPAPGQHPVLHGVADLGMGLRHCMDTAQRRPVYTAHHGAQARVRHSRICRHSDVTHHGKCRLKCCCRYFFKGYCAHKGASYMPHPINKQLLSYLEYHGLPQRLSHLGSEL